MNKEEFQNLLSSSSNYGDLLIDLKKAKDKLYRVKRRLKTIEKNHLFLYKIVSINGDGNNLEKSLKSFFRACGFNNVKWNGKGDHHDLTLCYGDSIIIIEASGTKSEQLKSNHVVKTVKYVSNYQTKNNKFGLTILNHDNKKAFNKRSENPFINKEEVKFAITSKITMVSTVQLLKGYLALKSGKLTLDDFFKILTSGKIVTF